MGEFLKYKDKPLVHRGNMIYYGDPSEKYIIMMIVNESRKVEDLDVSTSVTIQLQENTKSAKIIKKAERDGMYAAMDIAEYWLDEAIEATRG